MTFLANDPKNFPADSLRGFTAAFSDYVQPVHGGVVRSTTSPKGEVSIVVGGGSGHYPAFAGWVGPGMAHGSVCGNIFASPSSSQVTSVVRAAENGGGTILLFGNYAGDVLHFGNGAEELRGEGIDVRIVTISDDIASNPPEKHNDRRGIAGDLFVAKVAGGAAAAGLNIDDVERVTLKANEAVRTLGVAFTGCTLPGATEPLFEVPKGTYAVGLGIHGEPGISSHEMATSREIAATLVNGVMAEEPTRGENGYNGRVAVIVNGLGSTKYEELFVLYADVKDLLEERGVEIVAPCVDEQVTSLDMAGCSLTVAFLDEEIEKYWLAPADTPAYKTGTVAAQERRTAPVATVEEVVIEAGAPESAEQAAKIVDLLRIMADTMIEAEPSLGKLDSIAGDGDHGQGMVLGSVAAHKRAAEVAELKAGARTTLVEAGKAWSEGAGGTSGALWGGALVVIGNLLDDAAAVDAATIADAVSRGAHSIAERGGAKVGDKTMVDATEPFASALAEAFAELKDLKAAWAQAAEVATKSAEGTADLAARKGRARTHGDASLGYPDPGAISFALLMRTLAEKL